MHPSHPSHPSMLLQPLLPLHTQQSTHSTHYIHQTYTPGTPDTPGSPTSCSPSKSPPPIDPDIHSSEPTESSLPSQDPSSSHSEITVANQSPNHSSTLTIPFHYPCDQPEGDHDGKFFKEHMDSSLEGLLPAFVFHARMKALNAKLGALKPRQFADWMPVVRLAAVGMFACVSAYFLGSSQERPGLMLWCGSLVALVAVIFASFRRSSTLEKVMQTSINAFNRQDEHLLIRWRLLPLQAQRHSVFFSWRLVHGCRHSIPWKIQISHCKKNGDEAVFLPEYTPRFSSTFLLCDRGLQGIEVAEAFSVDGQLVEVAEGSSLAPVSHAGSEDALNAAEDAMLARSEFGIVGQKTATASRPPSYKSFLI